MTRDPGAALVEDSGNLPGHLLRFARLLRRAGLPIGPGQVMAALEALDAVDLTRREDFYWALHAVFVHRKERREVFELAFDRFWREPGAEAGGEGPDLAGGSRLDEHGDTPPPAARRVRDALDAVQAVDEPGSSPAPARSGDEAVSLAYSAREALRTRDFAAMSAEELEEARALITNMRFAFTPVPTRRFRPDPRGVRVDPRASLRAALRGGPGTIPLRWRRRRRRPPPLVALCDISGSMEPYTRMLLLFLHTLSRERERVHSFLFGTSLTNVTRVLRQRDPDDALERVGSTVRDWSGGTRIGQSLRAFNRRWSRRVLTRGGMVLLITDGLDREAGRGLTAPMVRLRRSCDRLVWLNPLLRFQGFEPRAAGIRAMLPHVDDFRTIHDLRSLEELVEALEKADRGGAPFRSGRPLDGVTVPPPY